jgi:hypothetical protein
MVKRERLWRWPAALAAALMLSAPHSEEAPSCATEPDLRLLDFWVGDWEVFVGETLVGRNRIEPVLGGCAITETWTDRRGNEGRSLFYYLPAERTWRQVWVTDRALAQGGLKEKTLVERLEQGGLRFQGEVRRSAGPAYLDRTTLLPGPRGSVRQIIEVSSDGGATWQATFDARYVRMDPVREE